MSGDSMVASCGRVVPPWSARAGPAPSHPWWRLPSLGLLQVARQFVEAPRQRPGVRLGEDALEAVARGIQPRARPARAGEPLGEGVDDLGLAGDVTGADL